MRGALSGTLATMGPALPYAVAAKFVHPDRPVIAIDGDGAMQMNGINALIDVAKYRDRWSDPRFIVLVLNNRDLNQVTWEQRVLAGDPEARSPPRSSPTSRTPATPSCSASRASASTPPTRSRRRGSGRWPPTGPVVVEAVVDPEVPPLPPHIEFEQAEEPRPGAGQGRSRARPDRPPVAEGEGEELLDR